mmetsp:Transcript_5397/g.11881  ORF Transcript_5397/g.11881 Transcript_5397/m.11881 type:complete len:94 (-) Transcript_5397:30-311(-)
MCLCCSESTEIGLCVDPAPPLLEEEMWEEGGVAATEVDSAIVMSRRCCANNIAPLVPLVPLLRCQEKLSLGSPPQAKHHFKFHIDYPLYTYIL